MPHACHIGYNVIRCNSQLSGVLKFLREMLSAFTYYSVNLSPRSFISFQGVINTTCMMLPRNINTCRDGSPVAAAEVLQHNAWQRNQSCLAPSQTWWMCLFSDQKRKLHKHRTSKHIISVNSNPPFLSI